MVNQAALIRKDGGGFLCASGMRLFKDNLPEGCATTSQMARRIGLPTSRCVCKAVLIPIGAAAVANFPPRVFSFIGKSVPTSLGARAEKPLGLYALR